MTEKYKILLVEDDVINAKLVKDFLVYKGYELFLVNNGLEVMNKIELHKPDLVLMDIQIFGQSGVDCAKQVRAKEEFKDLPIFAVSAFSKEKILEEEEMLLFDEYIEKPIVFSEFIQLLQAYLKINKEAK